MSPTDTSMGFAMQDLIGNFKWKRMGILTSATDNGKNTKQRVSKLHFTTKLFTFF